MGNSGYVVAGFETLVRILNKYINDKDNPYRNDISKPDISRFFSDTCSGFLRSYGDRFKGKKRYGTYNLRESEGFLKNRNSGYFDNSELYIDSGGFQISIGLLTLRESKLLLQMYYEFLEEYDTVYDKAFILDIPPGPGCEIFHNEKQLYDLNLQSYLKAKSLPDHIRKKIIYIHHFRTPMLWKTYNKLLKENDMFDSFDYHGTGGIVANSSSDMSIPCIIYILPIITLLNECIKYKRKKLNFHVLGGSGFRDILFYELFKVHVKKIHDIELNITYDSSGLFKGLMRARVIHTYDGVKFTKLDLRSDKINLRYNDNLKVVDLFRNELEDLSSRHPYIKTLKFDNMYEMNKDGTLGGLTSQVRLYSLLYMMEQFSRVHDIVSGKIKDYLYDLYSENQDEEFINEICEIIKTFNGGKLTKKQYIKSMAIKNSLDLLTTLDEDHCEYLVNTYLSKDEFTNLNSKSQVLTI